MKVWSTAASREQNQGPARHLNLEPSRTWNQGLVRQLNLEPSRTWNQGPVRQLNLEPYRKWSQKPPRQLHHLNVASSWKKTADSRVRVGKIISSDSSVIRGDKWISYIQGDRNGDKWVVVKFKAKIDIKWEIIYPVSVGDDYFWIQPCLTFLLTVMKRLSSAPTRTLKQEAARLIKIETFHQQYL